MALCFVPQFCIDMRKVDSKDVIIVGNGPELQALYERLKRPERVRGVFCGEGSPLQGFLPCLGDVGQASSFVWENDDVHRVYCGTSMIDVSVVRAIQASCKVRGVKFCAVLPVVNELDEQLVTMKVGKHLLLTPKSEPLSRFYNLLVKRLFDIVLALILLMTVFPVVYLVKYVCVRKNRGGAVLHSRRCMGPDNRVFHRLQFGEDDLQGFGIDALPQLLNILVGQMSFVGPQVMLLGDEAIGSAPRFERKYVKGGLVECSKRLHVADFDHMRNAIWYVGHWSLWLDLRILCGSVWK